MSYYHINDNYCKAQDINYDLNEFVINNFYELIDNNNK